MFRKLTVLAASLVVALTTFAIAPAQDTQAPAASGAPALQKQQRRRALRRQFMRRRARLGTMRGLRALNLTDAQKQQAQSIIRSNFERNQAVREEFLQLVQKRRQGTLSETAQTRAQELRKQLQESRKTVRTQLATLLTDEQKSKLEERRKTRRERRERLGRRGMNRPI